ncbi:PREDICTED: trypsin-1-like [Ceratosolen solmsi marchali]|uniref:trypsin n=1 Tax=Ceratosolen solmsi marchali TaxID=326594 RepID=A0AAJ6YNV3_9HYME|nr:PREDICTED: trypsin-1-like [Ceratosolen solmsi marchali]
MEIPGGILSLREPIIGQRIVGGTETDIRHHPYQVTLQYSGMHNCGGSIISKKWIVTAAHCISISGYTYTVGAGSNHRFNGKLYNVSRLVPHPNYVLFGNDYDIALIKIAEKFKYSPNIKPIKLPKRELKHGETVNVTGWGLITEGGSDTDILMKVTLPIVNRKLCKSAYKHINLITNRMICAGRLGSGGKDSCQGDSGGPLSANDTLYGIVSWGYGCARPNYPGVYTNVAYFRRWIANITGI